MEEEYIKERKCILIEWFNHLDENDYYSTTFELFIDVKKAFEFAKSVSVCRISLVSANNTFFEDDVLNYDDKSDTISEVVSIVKEKE